MPPIIPIQTDLYSILGVTIGAFLFGVVVTWLLKRTGAAPGPSAPGTESEGLLLVFSRLSHRLKTVGEVIRGHLYGFSDELPTDGERWRVARRAITEEASGIDSLVNRLDLVVRLGLAEQPLVMEPVNVPRLLEDLMVELGPAADARGIVLGGIVNHAGQEIPHISADPMALREVFSNLLENAVKHNGAGTEISAEVTQQDGRLVVDLQDNGQGIAPEVLENLFARGSRRYRPGVSRGSGMGLYLCKLLVELHRGEITARGAEGQGTGFHITLPLRRN